MIKKVFFSKSLSSDKKSMFALVGGTTLAQVLSFLFSPIQTRLFSPEVFGELSVFSSITGIMSIIICLRYELAIVLPDKDDEGYSLLELSWLFTIILSLLSLFVFAFWRKQIFTLFNTSSLSRYWYYVPITLMLAGIIQATNYWLIRKRQFVILSYNKVLPVITINLVSIGFGFSGNRALGARLFATLISNIVNIAVLLWALIPEIKIKEKETFSKIDLIKKYKNFIIFDIWGALINNLSWMIVPIIMNYYYGSFAAGQYSIGMRVIQIPASVIGASIYQIFLKNASEKRNNAKLYEYSLITLKRLLIYTFPILLLISIFGRYLFLVLFGNKWYIAGVYSQILSPWALLWFCASPMHSIFTITQKQNIYLGFSIFNILTRFLSLYLGKVAGNNDILGIILFSISGFTIYGISLILALKHAKLSDLQIKIGNANVE